MLKRLLIGGLALSALLMSSQAHAQLTGAKATDPALQAAIEARQKAVDARNATDWAKVTADGFVLVNADGTILNKSQRMKSLAANTNKPGPVVMETIQMFGPDAAVTIQHNPTPAVAGNARIVSFWVRQGGVWKMATTVGGVYPGK